MDTWKSDRRLSTLRFLLTLVILVAMCVKAEAERPQPPQLLTVLNNTDNINSTSIRATWQLPNDGNGGFTVCCNARNSGQSSNVTVAENATTGTCQGLTPGEQYAVTVVTLAVDGSQTSDPAGPLYAVTVPLPPDELQVLSSTTDSISANWTLPLGLNDGFTMVCDGIGLATVTVRTDVDATNATCFSVTAGSDYHVTVSTIASGHPILFPPQPSASVFTTTIPNLPNITIVNDTNSITPHTITATWKLPSGNNGGFKMYCDARNGQQSSSVTAAQNAVTATCTGLTPGEQYTVTAVTLAFQGSENSQPAGPLYAVTVPLPPANPIVVNTTTTTITIEWTIPDGLNDGFYVDCSGAYDGLPVFFRVKPNITQATCEGVSPGNDYTYNQIMTIAMGNPDFPEPTATPFLPALTWPLPPTSVVAVGKDPTTLAVTFGYDYGHIQAWCDVFVTNIAGIPTVVSSCYLYYAEVKDLKSDKNYTLVVAAMSEGFSGSHNYYYSSPNVTSSGWTRPYAVRDLRADPYESRALNITWTAPTDYPSDAMQYQMQVFSNKSCLIGVFFRPHGDDQIHGDHDWYPCFEEVEVDIDRGQLDIDYRVSNLTPFTLYTILAYAINLANSSEPNRIEALSQEEIPSSVNTESIALKAAYDSVTLSWKPPEEPNGIISGYAISYSDIIDNPDGEWMTVGTGNLNTSFTVDGLEALTNYSFMIAACNVAGCGDFSGKVYAMTKIGDPFPPIDIEADAASSSSLRVTWGLAPDARPAGETVYYDVKATDSENTTINFQTTVVGFDSNEATVDGLHPYWVYDIMVTSRTMDPAINQTYTTDGASMTNGRTDESTPGPVVSFSVSSLQADNLCDQLKVQWQPPTGWDSHGNITSYTVTVTPNNGGDPITETFTVNDSGNATTVNFTNVDPNNAEYNAKIHASTSKGPGTETNLIGSVSTGNCKPPAITDDTAENVISKQNSASKSSVTVTLSKCFLCDVTNGGLTLRGVIVTATDKISDDPHPGVWSPTVEALNEAYGPWSDNGYIAYRATADDWNPCEGFDLTQCQQGNKTKRSASSDEIDFVVGDGDNCSGSDSYCNKPLQDQSSYTIKLVICTAVGCQVTSYPPFVYDTDENLAWVAAVVIVPVAVVVVLLVVFLYVKPRKYANESQSSHNDVDMVIMDGHDNKGAQA